jgi:hypothetical protein
MLGLSLLHHVSDENSCLVSREGSALAQDLPQSIDFVLRDRGLAWSGLYVGSVRAGYRTVDAVRAVRKGVIRYRERRQKVCAGRVFLARRTRAVAARSPAVTGSLVRPPVAILEARVHDGAFAFSFCVHFLLQFPGGIYLVVWILGASR